MTTVIKVENLGKKYIIDHKKRDTHYRYETLGGALASCGKQAVNFFRHPIASLSETVEHEEFWALKDINFEIQQGDRVGIIGRNGAGKSTLLKILSRITAPTTGQIRIKGRVASLLEVGTGFHPELTGRENIYLNGAILGMKRQEIKAKFDEIVAFAEVEKFLDTPVKHYSSGMYVRLAFAVAAHLEPEILIVDEVLAVGDTQFQKKCLGKMDDICGQGKTILFVSHNMATIENICEFGLVFNKGYLAYYDNILNAINFYLNSYSNDLQKKDLCARVERGGYGNIRIVDFVVEDSLGNKNIPFPIGSCFSFVIKYKAQEVIKNPRIIIGIYDLGGIGITRFDSDISGVLPSNLPNSGSICCSTNSLALVPNRYIINIAYFSNGILEDYLVGIDFFDIINSDYFNTGKSFNENDMRLIKIITKHQWKVL
jgi:lipopolysaccharide transport system ATP-binding protein